MAGADDAVFIEYFERFDESPPFRDLQGYSEKEQAGLLQKAIDRGYPLGDQDFSPVPPGAET